MAVYAVHWEVEGTILVEADNVSAAMSIATDVWNDEKSYIDDEVSYSPQIVNSVEEAAFSLGRKIEEAIQYHSVVTADGDELKLNQALPRDPEFHNRREAERVAASAARKARLQQEIRKDQNELGNSLMRSLFCILHRRLIQSSHGIDRHTPTSAFIHTISGPTADYSRAMDVAIQALKNPNCVSCQVLSLADLEAIVRKQGPDPELATQAKLFLDRMEHTLKRGE